MKTAVVWLVSAALLIAGASAQKQVCIIPASISPDSTVNVAGAIKEVSETAVVCGGAPAPAHTPFPAGACMQRARAARVECMLHAHHAQVMTLSVVSTFGAQKP